MALPNNEILNITELKAAIAANDLQLASGATVPADSPECPDFDSLDDWLALNTAQYVADGYRLDRLPVLGATAFINYIINVLGVAQILDNPNAYGTSANDNFGYSVAISGNYAIVGAFQEDDANGSNSGKAYIFNASTGALVNTLNNPNAYGTSVNDSFGYSVGISGNNAIVGAYQEDDANGTESGKAYIFDVLTGNLLHTLNNPNAYDTSAYDNFGNTVAISGSYAVVGALNEDDAGGINSGKAYIFDVSTGNLLHTLNNPNAFGTAADDYFGYSVAINDTNCIVGAYREDDATDNSSGKAYIFNNSTGALVHTLDNPNTISPENDKFGWSVSISDTYCAVGATQQSFGGEGGKVYIFNNSTGALVHTLDNPNVHGDAGYDYFGHTVSLSDTYCVVGAYDETNESGSESGEIYIFNVSDGSLLHSLDNPNAYDTQNYDNFGYSVAVSGNNVIAGANQEDDAAGTNSGKAYIYDLS